MFYDEFACRGRVARCRERASCGALGLRCAAAIRRQLFQGQALAAPFSCFHQVKVTIRRDATPSHPRIDRGIGQAKVGGEIARTSPDLLDVLHSTKLRNLRSISQYANRRVNSAFCVARIHPKAGENNDSRSN